MQKRGSGSIDFQCKIIAERNVVWCADVEHVIFKVIYAWARDAPRLNLPDGVGFKVGKSSPIKYLVLQVHYANIDKFRGKCIRRMMFIYYYC